MTERRGGVVNAPASCSGVTGFKSRLHGPSIRIVGFHAFPQNLQANVRIVA
jgi:hypothetical protein